MRIKISIHKQSLTLIDNNKIIKTYLISSAEKGLGNHKNSNKTPTGKHIVRAKIGANAKINSVFVGRRLTGKIYSIALAKNHPTKDWILSRIIWLSGTEKGINRLGNVDTMQRYIYIHGTPDSEPMGRAKSHGCIRMRNHHIIELFKLIAINTKVEIIK